MNNIYLNFGAGNPVANWINLDSSPFFMMPKWLHVVLSTIGIKRSKQYLVNDYSYFKLTPNSKLPFSDNSVSAIHTSHVQEHLSVEENKTFFSEAH